MTRTTRQHSRTIRWFCPECSGTLLIDCHAQAGKHYRACATCRDETGFPVEAQRVVIANNAPPNRRLRLGGFPIHHLRKTRSK